MDNARYAAKRRRTALRIANGDRPPSPAQLALLAAIADPNVRVGCALDRRRPGRRISWIERQAGPVRRQNVTTLCDEMEFAGLIELGDPEALPASTASGWRLTSGGRELLMSAITGHPSSAT